MITTRKLLLGLAVAVSTAALGNSAQAANTVINFDQGYAAFTQIVNQYSAQGVSFTGAQILNDNDGSLNFAQFPPYSGHSVIYDNDNGTDGGVTGIIRATSTSGTWTSAGAYLTSNVAITMFAFDINGNLLGTSTTPGANYVGSGGTPNAFVHVDAPGISYVEYHDTGNTFTLDDFTFTYSGSITNVVPLPSAVWGGLSMLGGLGLVRVLRRRKASA